MIRLVLLTVDGQTCVLPLYAVVPGRFAGGHVKLRDGHVANPPSRPTGTGQTLFGRRRDGNELRLEIGLSPFTASGRLLFICSVRDASLRVRAEVELRESLKRSETVSTAMPLWRSD